MQTPTDRLTDAEMEIAKRVHTGKVQCELGADVTVAADEKNPGFFHVSAGKQRFFMHPVESRTGAIRLEDIRTGAMLLQLGNKSMLMNQKLGQRVADECAAPQQRALQRELGRQQRVRLPARRRRAGLVVEDVGRLRPDPVDPVGIAGKRRLGAPDRGGGGAQLRVALRGRHALQRGD